MFFNFIGDPNSFPSLITLNTKKLLYWLNCNKTPITIKTVKKNLIKFLSIQLETYKSERKKKLDRIWEAVTTYNPTPLHNKDKSMVSVYIVLALSNISACIGVSLYCIWIYAALEMAAWLYGGLSID